jgi:hypothetical protein
MTGLSSLRLNSIAKNKCETQKEEEHGKSDV